MKKIAANASRCDLGKMAISAAKSAGNELATSAISTAKDIAIEKGKHFLKKSCNKNVRPLLSDNQGSLLSEPKINKVKRVKRN